MNRIRNTSQRLVEVLVFYRKKNIKLQPVTPLMPLEALLIPVNPTNSDYDGINGGTGCNFIFFLSFCEILFTSNRIAVKRSLNDFKYPTNESRKYDVSLGYNEAS